MSKFIKKLALFVAAATLSMIAVVLFDYFVIGSQYKYSYQASLIDKVERLESIKEPKIILVGHSNLAFGINSEEIENAIGMPVVNLGLHGGLGNAYHEQIAKLGINEGDIVVVCHSEFSDTDEIGDPMLAWITYDYNNQLWPIIREKDYKAMLRAYPKYLRKSYLRWILRMGDKDPGGSYSRSAFNKYGDIIYRPADEQLDVEKLFSETSVEVPEINDICINRLNELYEYCRERGATMVVAGYPVPYGQYSDFTEEDFEDFKFKLVDMLDCDVISDYTDYFYPYDFFYNAKLHLTEEGAEVRTKQLISDLENWLEKR